MNNQSRTYNSTRNIMMGTISKIVAALLTFVGRKVFLLILPLEYLGINGLFVDVLSMLTLADLGMATAMAYSFYKPLAEKDQLKLAALINFYKKVYNVIAIVVAVLGVSLVPFLQKIVRVEQDIPYLELYYLIALANTVISYLFVYKSSIITADQKGYVITQYSMWTNSIRMIVQMVILYITKSYLLYSSVSVIATLINNLLISYQANKRYPFIKNKAELNAEEKKDIFRNIKSAFIYKSALVVNGASTNIIISIIVGTSAVGIYANYNVTVNNLFMLTGIVFSSITASLGNLVVVSNEEKKFAVYKTMQTASFWLSGFLTFCLYFMMDNFIVLWLGKEYLFNDFTKIAILLNFYLTLTMLPVTSFREAGGLFKKIKNIVVVSAVVNILLSVLLGKLLGVGGIILSSFIARLVTYTWYEPVILFKEFFGAKVSYLFFNHLKNFGILAICVLVFETIVPKYNVTNWLGWIISGCVYALVINLVYLIYYKNSQEFKIVKNKALLILKSFKK